MSSVIFSGNDVKTLKSNIDLNGNAKILSGSTDPTSSATSAPIGSIYLNTSNGYIYKKQDAGSSTNWVKVSTGNDSGINYVKNPDFEAGTSGWSTYADAAGASPVDGTGGTPTLTLTRTTTSPLRGTGSGLITKDAANRQGEGGSYDFTIDSADQAKMLSITFDYEIASGTYSGGSSSTDSDLTVYVYDVTNAQVIQPAGYKISGAVSGIKYKHSGCTFQAASNSTSYRLIFHTATTSTSAFTVKVDNISVGPQVSINAPAMTDWTSYTPTISAWSTNTSASGLWRRVGGDVEIQVKIALTGAPTGTLSSVSLPSGLTLDTTRLVNGSSTVVGSSIFLAAGTGLYLGDVTINGSNLRPNVFQASGSYVGVDASVTATVPGTFANNDYILMTARVPISGWSSNSVMSNDTDTRVVAASYTSIDGANPGGGRINFNNKVVDTHNAVTTGAGAWVFSAPVPGIYSIDMVVYIPSGGVAQHSISLQKNGSTVASAFGPNSSPYLGSIPISATLSLNAGDTIYGSTTWSAALTTTAGINVLNIKRLSGPSAIAASEAVVAKATTSNTSITTGATTTIVFSSSSFDTHGGYSTSTGKYTVPVSGKYEVVGAIYTSNTGSMSVSQEIGLIANQSGSASITNKVARFNAQSTSANGAGISGSTIFNCLAGDQLWFTCNNGTGNTITMSNSSADQFFTIKRIGN